MTGRPDVFMDCLTHVVVQETNENSHSSYDCSCENKRLMQLFTDVGDRPIVFVRFNPDAYVDATGGNHATCFKYHKQTGVPIVASKTAWEERLRVLNDRIMFHIVNILECEVTAEHLYYYGFH